MKSLRAVTLVVGCTIALLTAAHARDITLPQYRKELSTILADVDAGHLTEAQNHAKALNDTRIVPSLPATEKSTSFKPDSSILHPLEKAVSIDEAKLQAPRIKSLLNGLQASDAAMTPDLEPDQKLLGKLRDDEALVLPPKDGDVDDGGLLTSGYFGAIVSYLGEAYRWISQKISDLMKWLESLFPTVKPGFGSNVGSYVKIIVVVFAAILLILLLRAYFRSRKFRPVADEFAPISAPVAAKDADPMSRDSDQWEDYARKLAALGRHREAVRAWYHAILVVLFRSGVLTYRKGRTNWEYFFSFSPDFADRNKFQELTGSFELEWYGKSASDPDDATRYAEQARQFLARARSGRNA